MNHSSINTANTLSVRFRPGEDKRIPAAKSESIFTFGDFRITRDTSNEAISGESSSLKFDSFSTLDSINGTLLIPEQKVWVRENELHHKKEKPENYTYFGSFYTDVSNAINNIIEGFPYAILSHDNSTGITLYDYTESISGKTNISNFKIPYSALTNQGEIIIASGITTDKINLYNNKEEYAIQFSGSSDNKIYNILGYNFINLSGSNSYLDFTIEGFLFNNPSSSSTMSGVYIRPNRKRYNLYIKNLPSLERHVFLNGEYEIPNQDDDGVNTHTIEWPKTIDGFNPDISGVEFDHFIDHILKHAIQIDDVKTNWIMRTMIPENYLEFDTEGAIYRKMIQVYAHEFDMLKRYIDGMAYAYTVPKERENEESIPNKFLPKLAGLLSWDLQGNFNESDLFEYLAGEIDSSGTSSINANFAIWKKILSNINWLYKKKGTRDALTFIFKLVGAPDSIVNFNEFIYKINRTVQNTANASNVSIFSHKINDNGYINYDASQYIFQEGGKGRGNGQAYISQWKPEFEPTRIVDNKKILTGDSSFFGSENIINSKEVSIELTAAKAIETDVKTYYTGSGSCINNSFIDTTDLNMEKCEVFTNSNYESKTLAEYLDYIYTHSIDPTNRKTIGFTDEIVSHYPTLKKAYLNYYFNETVASKKLTFEKLESFLDKIGSQISEYIFKLIPATTIFESAGTTYRNTLFTAPKFVYKEGINTGSEFRNKIIPEISDTITTPTISATLNQIPKKTITNVTITASTSSSISNSMASMRLNSSITAGINSTISGNKVSSSPDDTNTSILNID